MSFRRVSDRIWQWSQFSDEKQLNFNGTLLKVEEWVILIDPVSMTDDMVQEVRDWGDPEAILLTNRDHCRAAGELRRALDVPIWVSIYDAKRLPILADCEFKPKDLLPGGIVGLHLGGMKTAGETAFHWPDGQVLVVGDAVIGRPSGSLRLLPPEKIPDEEAAREELRGLLEIEFAHLMVGDGDSIPATGKEALAAFLQGPTGP